MLTRRSFIKSLVALGLSGVSLSAYALGIEPRFRLEVTRYRLAVPRWPKDQHLRLAILADIHASEPYMPPVRLQEIVDRTNTLGADLILLLGDYAAAHRWQTRKVPPAEWASILAGLKAPLGVHAVLGNHDWWDDHPAQRRGKGPVGGRIALERVGIPVYENDAVRLTKGRSAFWLAGLGDQLALIARWRGRKAIFKGVDDLPKILAAISDDAPIILMAHEPDIFPSIPDRISLTLSGHTHGGQVRIAGYSPIVPSIYGNRFAYGHVVEEGRHLIVSGGLGCSRLPVRFGMPPEIVVVDLGDPEPVA